jgi:hypothetical protein
VGVRTMMTAREAEQCAFVAWQAFQQLTSSEVAAQAIIAGTPEDFESFALQMLTEAFLTGRVRHLTPRIDAMKNHAQGDATNELHFHEPPKNMTYSQAILALQEQVPSDLRMRFKRIHAAGATPYAAYLKVMRAWEERRETMQSSQEALHS